MFVLLHAWLTGCGGDVVEPRPSSDAPAPPAVVVPSAPAPLPASPGTDPAVPIPAATTQLVVVRTADWDAVPASLGRFRKVGGAWVPDGPEVPAVVGRSGLGWGRGRTVPSGSGPVKREGDGRAPAGVFTLGEAMGEATTAPPGQRWAYRPAAGRVCVDDVRSQAYNRILGPASPVDGTSHERLDRGDGLYRWFLLVDHNGLVTGAPVPGAGSCIFLHVWRAAERGTDGCTALAEEALRDLLAWLDPAAAPLVVQLPAPTFAAVREEWGLP